VPPPKGRGQSIPAAGDQFPAVRRLAAWSNSGDDEQQQLKTPQMRGDLGAGTSSAQQRAKRQEAGDLGDEAGPQG
jgi:hypothetical protein